MLLTLELDGYRQPARGWTVPAHPLARAVRAFRRLPGIRYSAYVFDILAYLVERYYELGAYPDADTLSRQLAAAGFETQDIHQALDWLSGLEQDGTGDDPEAAVRPTVLPALRHYTPSEQRKTRRGKPRIPAFPRSCGCTGRESSASWCSTASWRWRD